MKTKRMDSDRGRGWQSLKRVTAGTLAGAALLTGSAGLAGVATADTKSETAAGAHEGLPELPGVGELIGLGKEIYEAVELCEANEEAGLPCTQSTDKTIAQMYGLISEFVKQYEIDQKRAEAAMSDLSIDVKDSAYEAKMLALTSDFERAHGGLQIYQALGQCSVAYVQSHGKDGHGPATCPKVDAEGNQNGEQVADAKAISRLRTAFLRSQNPDKYRIEGANDMLNRVGGTKANSVTPYHKNNESLLTKLVDRDRAQEKANLGLGVSDKLKFMGPDYVNRVGADVTAVINAESTYFLVRGLEQNLIDTDEQDKRGQTGTEFADAAARGGSNGSMSIEQQVRAFTFPDWSPSNLMKPNTAYVQMRNGSYVMITTHGNTTSKPGDHAGLLTAEQMAEITDVVGPILGKGLAQDVYPQVLPRIEGERPPGQAAKQAERDDAVARWWTAPQHVTDGALAEGAERTLLGYQLRARQERLYKPTHWKSRPAAHAAQRSLPYSVFAKPTDTIKGVKDAWLNLGQSEYAEYCGGERSNKPFTCFGSDRGDHKTEKHSWDAWATVHADPANHRGITAYQAPTWDSFWGHDGPAAQGVAVRSEGITAANVTSAPVGTAGLLNAAS